MVAANPVLICAHGGRGIGLGHVQRCLALARALAEGGQSSLFLTNDDPAIIQRIERAAFPVRPCFGLDGQVDLSRAGRAIGSAAREPGRKIGPLVAADSYALSSEQMARLCAVSRRLLVIDDLADRSMEADLVTNSAPGAEHLAYRGRPETAYLLGPEYALLGDEFAHAPRRVIRQRVERVLVALGSGDAVGPRAAWLATLVRSALGESVAVDFVAGPSFSGEEPPGTTVHRAPLCLYPLMVQADLALSGGGVTALELAATGTPTLAIELVANQQLSLSGLAQAGAVVHAGALDSPDLEQTVVQQIERLAADREARQDLSSAARALVDGKGSVRVARALVEGHAGGGNP